MLASMEHGFKQVIVLWSLLSSLYLDFVPLSQINKWCKEAGGNITINYIIKTPKAPATPADNTNPLWAVIENSVQEL